MSTTDTGGGPPDTSETIWERAHESTEFRELRSRLRRFVFPMTAVFLLWYLLYVRYANRKLDPAADAIRAEIEGEQPR